MKFKPGDKVVCIEASGVENTFTKGQVYTVEECKPDWVYFKGIPRKTPDATGWYPHRFRRIEPFQPADIVECIDNSGPGSVILSTGQHYTIRQAVPIRDRLCLEGIAGEWRPTRFRLVGAPQPEKPKDPWDTIDVVAKILDGARYTGKEDAKESAARVVEEYRQKAVSLWQRINRDGAYCNEHGEHKQLVWRGLKGRFICPGCEPEEVSDE